MLTKGRLASVLCATILAFSFITSSFTYAFDQNGCENYDNDGKCVDEEYILNDISIDKNVPVCTISGKPTSESTEEDEKSIDIGAERDYKGRPILNSAQISAIKSNRPTYEAAAKEADIPWQMLAAIHLRESGLKVENPSNGLGVYQDTSIIKPGTKVADRYESSFYTPGPISADEFLAQSKKAAALLKSKASKPKELTSNPYKSIEMVKDAFFGYNGRSSQYAQQAKDLGFANDYDGSPYVMNKVDEKRDPEKNPDKWGQIKTDGGKLVYPANNDYGAYPVFASIAGISLANCGGELGQRIAQKAEAEYALWQSGAMRPGFRKGSSDSFSKYMNGNGGFDWCAMFASWLLTQVGKPLVGGNRGGTFESYAEGFRDPSKMSKNGFVVHHKVNNYDGYTPKPGDFVTYNWDGNMSGDADHVNVIVSYNADNRTFSTVGGNEGSESWSSSIVRKYDNRSMNSSVVMSITEVKE